MFSFFHDMPWLNVPNNRRTVFIEPARPCGGLLGGSSSSGKMSKLQALAAARKKKAEDQKLENQKIQPTTKEKTPVTAKQTARPTSGFLAERSNARQDTMAAKALPIHTKTEIPSTPDGMSEGPGNFPGKTCIPDSSSTADLASLEPVELAAPSAFARTLLGSAMSSPAPVPRNQYPIPYMTLTSSLADAFSEPSPDDVVLAAQSKGSLLAKKVQA
jgi:elongation factor 1 alpha-like protein